MSNEETGKCVVVTIDYNMTVEQMVAAGRYDNPVVNLGHLLTVKTEPRGVVQIELELVPLENIVSRGHGYQELWKLDKRPATLAELLGFGAACFDAQSVSPIIALGSFSDVFGLEHVPHLSINDSKRHLHVGWSLRGFSGHFLAADKFK
jgi:hypothetical protein